MSPQLAAFLIALSATICVAAQQYDNNNCDPGICGEIPGLVYNADLDQCAWPDEIGCSLKDLGYSTSCDISAAYDLKPVDFPVTNLPEGRGQGQYFIVCVPETRPEDRDAALDVAAAAAARSTNAIGSPEDQKKRFQQTVPVIPTGPVVPRLLGCPGEQVFMPEMKMCQ